MFTWALRPACWALRRMRIVRSQEPGTWRKASCASGVGASRPRRCGGCPPAWLSQGVRGWAGRLRWGSASSAGLARCVRDQVERSRRIVGSPPVKMRIRPGTVPGTELGQPVDQLKALFRTQLVRIALVLGICTAVHAGIGAGAGHFPGDGERARLKSACCISRSCRLRARKRHEVRLEIGDRRLDMLSICGRVEIREP